MSLSRLSLLPALALVPVVACRGDEPAAATNTEVDIDAAAERAQASVDAYDGNRQSAARKSREHVANAVARERARSATDRGARRPLAPLAPGMPGGLRDDRTPVSETRLTPDTAQGAAAVVQLYYVSLERKKYAVAHALWHDGTAVAKLDPIAFARTFAAYREYHANIGAPGRVDPGAGQRYVSVPVQVHARRIDGTPSYQIGRVTLRRSADIDGATALQKSWRIETIDLEPAP